MLDKIDQVKVDTDVQQKIPIILIPSLGTETINIYIYIYFNMYMYIYTHTYTHTNIYNLYEDISPSFNLLLMLRISK